MLISVLWEVTYWSKLLVSAQENHLHLHMRIHTRRRAIHVSVVSEFIVSGRNMNKQVIIHTEMKP